MSKVFLKFNRTDSFSLICLLHWLEVFKKHDIFIVCDLYDINKDPVPEYLNSIIAGREVKIINSNYNLGEKYTPEFKARKRKMASANLTCFEHLSKTDTCLWIIDADDTMFLTKNYEEISQRLINAEEIMHRENLDGFSLDFYRSLNNTWTFGVCLLNAKINWQQVEHIKKEDLDRESLVYNSDSIFDYLGRKGILKLKNFVFPGVGFQHIVNNFSAMPAGIYFWKNRKVWDIPLKDDVLEI